MSISIKAKTDYSSLFGSLGNGSANNMNGINLSDYASIKNGSYGKLIKAYYSKNSAEDIEEKKQAATDKASSLKKVATTADEVKKAADKLTSKGKDSVFNQKDIEVIGEDGTKTTKKGYDTDSIYKAVKSFADSYNSFINKAKKSSEDSVANRADSLANMMTVNYGALRNVGIEINDDDTLTVNEEKFKNSDMNAVKNLFNGNQSLAYQISAQASMIGTSATTAANSASGYTNSGTYQSSYSTGSMINDIV